VDICFLSLESPTLAHTIVFSANCRKAHTLLHGGQRGANCQRSLSNPPSPLLIKASSVTSYHTRRVTLLQLVCTHAVLHLIANLLQLVCCCTQAVLHLIVAVRVHSCRRAQAFSQGTLLFVCPCQGWTCPNSSSSVSQTRRWQTR